MTIMRQVFIALSKSKPLGHFATHNRVAWLAAQRFERLLTRLVGHRHRGAGPRLPV